MIVICKKGTKTTVKGGKYELVRLYNDGTNGRGDGKLYIKGFGKFSVGNFTDINGSPLPKINISARVPKKVLEMSDLKEGDILVCTTDKYKTFAKNGMYKIEKLFTESHTGYSKYVYHTHYIKFDGISRRISFNPVGFRKLTTGEYRDMSLNSVLSGEEPNIIKSKKVNKFELVDNKERFLMDSIMKSILDPRRHNLTVIDWTCEKIVPSFKLTPVDFDKLTNLTFKEILEKIYDEK